jgi:hypothetical protein
MQLTIQPRKWLRLLKEFHLWCHLRAFHWSLFKNLPTISLKIKILKRLAELPKQTYELLAHLKFLWNSGPEVLISD